MASPHEVRRYESGPLRPAYRDGIEPMIQTLRRFTGSSIEDVVAAKRVAAEHEAVRRQRPRPPRLPVQLQCRVGFLGSRTLEQFEAAVRRDFEEKSPTGTDIVERVEAGKYPTGSNCCATSR